MSELAQKDGSPLPDLQTAQPADFLFYVLAADRTPCDSTRYSLMNVDEVVFTRGESQGSHREGRRLILGFTDCRTAAPHARLWRHEQRWRLQCSNGNSSAFLNGQPTTEACLGDGDVIELGHRFFVFRRAQPFPPGAALDTSATTLQSTTHGLRTLSPRLGILFKALPSVAASGIPVVVSGETGTGKELLARAVHGLSRRRGPFIAVNCGGLPSTLIESELFGSRKGALSGATEDRTGLIRAADHGTLFLDEVVELSASAQTALLRALQEREVLPLGSTRPVAVDFRLIVASHCDLDEAVASGRFREDLRARLHGFTARLPALRDRREDVGILVNTIGAATGTGTPLLSREAARDLLLRSWPCNIRQLASCLRVAAILTQDGVVETHHLDGELSPTCAPRTARAARERTCSARDIARRDELDGILREYGGNVTHAARALGKQRPQIYRLLKRYGLDPSTYRR